MFLDNPSYKEAVCLLKEFHLLKREGKEDTDEADAIRDAMDKPWYELSEPEMARIKIMSADMDMLRGEETFRQVPPEQRTRKCLAPRLQAASERRDWATVLELLRNGPDYMTPDQIAHLRGQAYTELGHPDIARLFFDYAAEQNPHSTKTPAASSSHT